MRFAALILALTLSACQKPSLVCGGEPPAWVPGPDFACSKQLLGSMTCPRGQVGWGYLCTEDLCWRLYNDGPCAPAYSVPDPGMVDSGTPDSGSGVCAASGGLPPQFNPNGACTASIAGAMICPAGPSSGYGYECSDAGCWTAFADGPCSSGAPDSGTRCLGGGCDAGEEGRVQCNSGLRAVCSAGCWVDTGVCSADAGLLCGSAFGVRPSSECTPALVGSTVCPAGPSSGYGYTCTARGCWDGFLDGPCAYFDAGAGDGG